MRKQGTFAIKPPRRRRGVLSDEHHPGELSGGILTRSSGNTTCGLQADFPTAQRGAEQKRRLPSLAILRSDCKSSKRSPGEEGGVGPRLRGRLIENEGRRQGMSKK